MAAGNVFACTYSGWGFQSHRIEEFVHLITGAMLLREESRELQTDTDRIVLFVCARYPQDLEVPKHTKNTIGSHQFKFRATLFSNNMAPVMKLAKLSSSKVLDDSVLAEGKGVIQSCLRSLNQPRDRQGIKKIVNKTEFEQGWQYTSE